MGPRAGLDRCGKSRPHRDSIPRTVQPVAQSLHRLSHPGRQFSWVLVLYWNYPRNCWIIAECYVRSSRNIFYIQSVRVQTVCWNRLRNCWNFILAGELTLQPFRWKRNFCWIHNTVNLASPPNLYWIQQNTSNHTDNSFCDSFDESAVRTGRFAIRCFEMQLPPVESRMSVGTELAPHLVQKLLAQMQISPDCQFISCQFLTCSSRILLNFIVTTDFTLVGADRGSVAPPSTPREHDNRNALFCC